MKKIIYFLLVSGLILLSACKKGQAEEAESEIRQITSMPGEITLSFPEGWAAHEQNNGLLAENTVTGSSIMISYEDLTGTPGGELIHIEDYVEALQNNLKTAGDYTYHCEAAERIGLWGEEYHGFTAEAEELDVIQHFYIRQIEDKMMVITITLFEEDTLDTVLSCISPIE